MNDSLRTDVFVRFQPESIACACIYLAARTLEVSAAPSGPFSSLQNTEMSGSDCARGCDEKPPHGGQQGGFDCTEHLVGVRTSITGSICFQIPLPNRPHWFLLFGATEEEIQEICLKILQLYTRKKVVLCVFYHVTYMFVCD